MVSWRKTLWKSDVVHLNCALEHQWCKCAYLYLKNLTVSTYHTYFKSWSFCALQGFFPCAMLSLTGMWLLRELKLRQGLTPGHMAPWNKKTFLQVLPHRWVIATVCGNINLSPWWRNLCLSTVFYSVSSDNNCNRITLVKCMGPGEVLNVYLACGTYSAAWFLRLGTYFIS